MLNSIFLFTLCNILKGNTFPLNYNFNSQLIPINYLSWEVCPKFPLLTDFFFFFGNLLIHNETENCMSN